MGKVDSERGFRSSWSHERTDEPSQDEVLGDIAVILQMISMKLDRLIEIVEAIALESMEEKPKV